MADIGNFKNTAFTLLLKGAGKTYNSHSTCSPLFPETDFPGFPAIWFFCFQTQEATVAMKEKLQVGISCTTALPM